MNYPSFESLNTPPDYLLIGASAIHNLRMQAGVPNSRVVPERRQHVKKAPEERRQYVSRYIGVTRTQGHFVGQWRNERGTYARGPRRPDTPEGELQAAWDRARALGKSELEVRE